LARPVLGPGVEFPLLDGEAESGGLDAAHWVAVYEQLISFSRSVLAEDDVAESLDRGVLRRRLRHFEHRGAYWRRQLEFPDLG
jgi:hypothetical protein